MTQIDSLDTVRDLIRYAASRFNEAGLFFGHGTDNGWDEASQLVMHTIHLPYTLLPSALDAKLTRAEQALILALIKERVEQRVPLPYLTHQAWFAGLSFYVDNRVLIPRSPIAELIEKRFSPWIAEDNIHSILDLCTGSACIAIAAAHYMPYASVDATDISQDALAVAEINLLRHHLEEDIRLFQSDLFSNIPLKQYDLIITNPPYVDQYDMNSLPPEYQHEPILGLQAGTDGLAYVDRILKQAKDYLSPHGLLVVEVGNSEEALLEKYPSLGFIWPEFERGDGGVFILEREALLSVE